MELSSCGVLQRVVGVLVLLLSSGRAMSGVWQRGMMTGGVAFLLLVACAVCAAHGEWEVVYDHDGDGVVSVSEMMKAVTELDHVRHHEPDAVLHLQDTMMEMRDLVSSEKSKPRGWSVERMRSMYRHIFDDPSEVREECA